MITWSREPACQSGPDVAAYPELSREAYTERVIWEGEESVEGVTHYPQRYRAWAATLARAPLGCETGS